ncbi:MAG: hypothetical protein BGO86_03405 [Chryseobacterium sp. 36-9]|nr:MAG: hypothetical protein BGO86_03405 [Chryseobacterium sp. 36-9]
MQENRLFKYKFIYFYSIVFLFGWLIYYGFHIGNIVFRGFRLDESFGFFKIPLYLLFFSIFVFLILSLVNIFKESYRSILYFNIAICLLVTITFINSYLNQFYNKQYFIPAIILYLSILFFSAFLINYYKYKPPKNEIEEIGKS